MTAPRSKARDLRKSSETRHPIRSNPCDSVGVAIPFTVNALCQATQVPVELCLDTSFCVDTDGDLSMRRASCHGQGIVRTAVTQRVGAFAMTLTTTACPRGKSICGKARRSSTWVD